MKRAPRNVGLPMMVALAWLVAGCSRGKSVAPDSLTDTPQAVAATIEMIPIPAGRFIMGTEPEVSFQNGFPPHAVQVAAFRLARHVVSFEQYDAFARATQRELPIDEGWGRGSRPVIHVTWRDAQAFIAWLNQGTGRRYRLPSEAEFEYAMRAGTTSLYWWGDEPNPNMANTAADVGRDQYPFTSPVDAFPRNPFGLHDMGGNVWQMTQDCRHGSYDGAPTDGSAWVEASCDGRVVRGGGFGGKRRAMQSAARAATGETFDSAEMGFRLAESL
jgi:formylglycine-generating enzyme required for sulfatase activity